MVDLILYISLGLVVIILSVWGEIVSAKSLPAQEKKSFHIGGFMILGFVASLLTVLVGVRNYSAQKEAKREQNSLDDALRENKKALDSDGQLIAQMNATLTQSRLDAATIQGQLQMVGPVLAAMRGDQSSAMEKLGVIIAKNTQDTGSIPNRYSLLSNSELKQETLELISNMRTFLNRINNQEAQIAASRTSQTWMESNVKEQALFASFASGYATQFKIDAQMLRNELMRREKVVPDMNKMPFLNSLYEYPTNPLGLEDVIDDLEAMAKSIPDSSTARRH